MHLHAEIESSSLFLRVLPLSDEQEEADDEEEDEVEDTDVFSLDVLFLVFMSASI